MNTHAVKQAETHRQELRHALKANPTNWALRKKLDQNDADLKHAYASPETEAIRKEVAFVEKTLTIVGLSAFQKQECEKKLATLNTRLERQTITRDYDYYMIPLSQNLAVLVDRVFERWVAAHAGKRHNLTAALLQQYRALCEAITLNLIYTKLVGLGGTTTQRGKADHTGKSRYKPSIYTQPFLTLLDHLEELNVLQQTIGERWKTNYAQCFDQTQAKYITKNLKRTIIQMGVELEALLQTYPIHSASEIGFNRERQEVILKKNDESSALVEYADDTRSEMYREQLKRINAWIEQAGPLVAPAYTDQIDDRQRFLVRRFTYGSFDSGGRLWGGFWDSPMKKTERPVVLRIQGQLTKECDYSTCMLRIAYAYAEVSPPEGDLYTIPGLSAGSRAGVKAIINALLFDGHTHRAKFPKPRDGEPEVKTFFSLEEQLLGFSSILDKIKVHHSKVAHLFGARIEMAEADGSERVPLEIGHYLQYVESQLLVRVLDRLGQLGVVALPIHDAVIVAEANAGIAKAVMERVSRRGTGQVIPVKIV